MKAKNIPTSKIIRLVVMSKEGTYPVCVVICCFNKIEIADNGQSYKASYDFMHIQGSYTFYINSHFYLNNDYNFKVEKPTYCDILIVKDLLMERKIKYNKKCMKFCKT